MRSSIHRLKDVAAWLAALGFAIMFVAFIVQIFSRYVLNDPTAWTQEVTLICYVWVVFWTAAFLLEERDQITFDMVAIALPPSIRRWLALACAVLVAVAFAIILPETLDWIRFMRFEKSPVLGLRYDWLYSIFILFSGVVIVRAILRARRLISSGWKREFYAQPEEPHE
ncbi:TRAP transporter small permease [Dongia deserti]|uniref:TRAP transporter small permease n=1 Tax=Dongia deserti TaxID=2268030 RepID=UPI0013C51B63|nr:TRAP transporter small permease [Dongia deserti]